MHIARVSRLQRRVTCTLVLCYVSYGAGTSTDTVARQHTAHARLWLLAWQPPQPPRRPLVHSATYPPRPPLGVVGTPRPRLGRPLGLELDLVLMTPVEVLRRSMRTAMWAPCPCACSASRKGCWWTRRTRGWVGPSWEASLARRHRQVRGSAWAFPAFPKHFACMQRTGGEGTR